MGQCVEYSAVIQFYSSVLVLMGDFDGRNRFYHAGIAFCFDIAGFHVGQLRDRVSRRDVRIWAVRYDSSA